MARHMRKALCVCLVAAASALAASQPLAAGEELICHPHNAADCYPRTFHATHEFQPVRPGQDIPPGLHVRLNVYTGEKEAKVNVPSEQDAALAGLPVENAVVTVDAEPQEQTGQHIRPGAPAYEAVGKVKEPNGPEAGEFARALTEAAKTKVPDAAAFDGALDRLAELSHDLYYGLKIAEDLPALSSLFCLMSGDGDASTSTVVAQPEAPRALLAARAISAAVQNNPVALKAIEQHWPALLATTCPGSGNGAQTLGRVVFSVLHTGAEPRPGGWKSSLARARLSAIKGLIRSPTIRQEFLDMGGMREVLRVLLVKDEGFTDAQVKAANLVQDTFLDENMGAAIGLWPAKPATGENVCDHTGPDLSDGCWRFWLGKIAEEQKSDPDHWSLGLLRMLADRRLGPGSEDDGRRPTHNEL